MNVELLERLVTTPGISGREERARELIVEELNSVMDEVRIDRLGNVIGRTGGSGSRVMLCAHMDTIGFLVSHIDDDGFLRVSPVGDFDARTLTVQRVLVQGKSDYVGLMSSIAKPIHVLDEDELKKVPKIEDVFVDVMLEPASVKANISIGDPISFLQEPIVTERTFSSPYLDDRLGVYVLIEAARAAREVQAEVYAVVSVQEEVGFRGARTSAFKIEPDVGVAIDVTLAMDVPGVEKAQRVTELGKGASLGLMDSSSISDPRLVRHFKEVAEAAGIKHQVEVGMLGGTDAGEMQVARAGAAAITISIPVRYVHTANEVATIEDIDAAVTVIARWLEAAHDLRLEW
jgi:tetrahedral aminopeptidase